jgi:lipid A 3-O-deacylase
MRRAAITIVLCTLWAASAAAGDFDRVHGLIDELRIGAVVHDVPGGWSGFHVEQDAVDLNLEAILSPSLNFLGGRIRPALGATVNFNGDTSKVYLDARWQRDFAGRWFAGIGLGVAVHDGSIDDGNPNKKQLGARVLFHPSFELGYRLDRHNSISLYYDHMSNGSTADPNEGFDTLGVRWGYRF